MTNFYSICEAPPPKKSKDFGLASKSMEDLKKMAQRKGVSHWNKSKEKLVKDIKMGKDSAAEAPKGRLGKETDKLKKNFGQLAKDYDKESAKKAAPPNPSFQDQVKKDHPDFGGKKFFNADTMASRAASGVLTRSAIGGAKGAFKGAVGSMFKRDIDKPRGEFFNRVGRTGGETRRGHISRVARRGAERAALGKEMGYHASKTAYNKAMRQDDEILRQRALKLRGK